jgi:hypothetical protein
MATAGSAQMMSGTMLEPVEIDGDRLVTVKAQVRVVAN